MLRDNLFVTPIWQENIHIDQQAIEYCLKLSKTTESALVSNIGGWQSELFNMYNILEFNGISKQLNSLIEQVSNNIGDIKLDMTDCWINVNSTGNSNARHCHPGSSLSGVVYLNVSENSGNINFYDNEDIVHYPVKTNSPIFSLKKVFKPKVGSVLIFPSWLWHSVDPNKDNTNRISIAFNTIQRDFFDERT